MLTVIREMAEAAEARRRRRARRGHRRGADAAARERRAHPVDAAVLRDAGVVDAGAAGLVEFCRGAVAGLRGEHIQAPLEAIERPLEPRGGAPGGVPVPLLHLVPARGRRHRPRPARSGARRDGRLPARGRRGADVQVHLHTDDPGAALSIAGRRDGQHRPASRSRTCRSRRAQRERRLAVSDAGRAPGGPRGRRPPDGREHRDRARLDRRPARIPQHEHPNWRMVPLTVALRRRAVRGRGRHRAGGVLPAAAQRRPAPADGGAVPGGLPAHVRGAGRTTPTSSSCRSPRGCRRSVQAARIAADDPAAGGRVTVLDGLTVSAGTVMLADGVQRLLEAGTDRRGGHGVGGGRARARVRS